MRLRGRRTTRASKAGSSRGTRRRPEARVPSANRITLLRDADGDGVAEVRSPFLSNLHSPFGMALVGDTLYVANTDAVVSVPYQRRRDDDLVRRQPRCWICRRGLATITGRRTSSPALTARSCTSPSARTATSPSTASRKSRAARKCGSWISPAGSTAYSPPDCAIPWAWRGNRESGALWVAVNERDELGNDLVPDYITSVRDGGFYGWPYSYFGTHVDDRVEPQRPDLVAKALVPDYALGSHTASLGLAHSEGNRLPHCLRPRDVRRPARVVEPQAAERLQGHLRALRRRQGQRGANRCADRVRQRRRRCHGTARWRRDRQARRSAGGRRCGQRCVAGLRRRTHDEPVRRVRAPSSRPTGFSEST